MSKNLRLLAAVLFITSTVLLTAGCAKAPEAEAPRTLTVWINGRDSFIGPNEQQLPQDQWYISQAIQRFEAAHPGVTVEMVVQADAYAAH